MEQLIEMVSEFFAEHLDSIMALVYIIGVVITIYRKYHQYWKEDAEAAYNSMRTMDENVIYDTMGRYSREARPRRIKEVALAAIFWPFPLAWSVGTWLGNLVAAPFKALANRLHEKSVDEVLGKARNAPDRGVQVHSARVMRCDWCNKETNPCEPHNCRTSPDSLPLVQKLIRCGKCGRNVTTKEDHICNPSALHAYPVKPASKQRVEEDENLPEAGVEDSYCEECDESYHSGSVAGGAHRVEFCTRCEEYHCIKGSCVT